MKATEFFKKVGIDAVKSYITAYEDHLTDELQNLVNAYELVGSFGGLQGAKDHLNHRREYGLYLLPELKQAIELVESVNE